MIEAVHGIRIVNRDQLIGQIMQRAGDRNKVSRITAALNSWVAMNAIKGEVEVPQDVLFQIFRGTGCV